MNPFLDHPAPDFDGFVRVLRGDELPRRVPLVELGIDAEIIRALVERYDDVPWFPWSGGFETTPPEAHYAQWVRVFYRLGYDYAPVWATWPGHPTPHRRITANTAAQADGDRHWTEEGQGLITSQADFEAFPWDAIPVDTRPVEYAARALPDGMKLTANTTFFEHVFENLLGYEGLSYLLYDEPELVAAVFERWGQQVYNYYAAVIDHDAVGAIFHADDMGFKTSTLISPRALRRYVLPWLKRYAALAHAHGKPFYLHSCGNLFQPGVIEDLIDDVGIDGYHSFQDIILPVTAFKAQYGDRVATLGGVDMDHLVRQDEPMLRATVRDILAACMPGGRYALGSGNTVANYVPVDHYVVMLDEARRWNGA